MNILSAFYLTHLSKPACDREIYRRIVKRLPRRIVELGLRDASRAARVIRFVAGQLQGQVDYTGVDLFEMRPDGSPLPLKSTYRLLRAAGARVRLAPGDPHSALARHANELTGTDLLIISADQPHQSLQTAWYYIPRMLHADSIVLAEVVNDQGEVTGYHRVATGDEPATTTSTHRRAA